MSTLRRTLITLTMGLMVGCAGARITVPGTPTEKSTQVDRVLPAVERLPTPTPLPHVEVPPLRGPDYEIRLPGYVQSIPFDGIRPVYDPQFVNAQDAQMARKELVIGVVVEGEAKAYPVTVLRFREMVNDEIAGIPILVSW